MDSSNQKNRSHQASRSNQHEANTADVASNRNNDQVSGNTARVIPPRLEMRDQNQEADQSRGNRTPKTPRTPNTPRSAGNKTPVTPRQPPVIKPDTPMITKFFRQGRDEVFDDDNRRNRPQESQSHNQKAPTLSDDEHPANLRRIPLGDNEQKRSIKQKLGQIVLDEIDEEFSKKLDRSDPKYIDNLPNKLSKSLTARLNELKTVYTNYKFINHVVVSRRSDDMKLEMRCCWDEKEDVFQNMTYTDDHIHCVVSALAVRS